MDDGTNDRLDEAVQRDNETTPHENGTTRRTLVAALGGSSVAAVAGCSTVLETGSRARFRLGTLRPPITLDPITAKSIGSEQLIGRVFDGLYEYVEGTDTVPKIAAGEPQFENDGRAAVVGFASLAFIVVFGAMSALALTVRDAEGVTVNPVPPLVGVVGSAAFFVMLTWYLYSQLPAVFWLVVAIAAAVFAVEAMYFKRETLSEGVRQVEKRV